MSAFSFAKGFAQRLGKRKDAQDKAVAAAKEQDAEDARYFKGIVLRNRGNLAVQNAKIEADNKTAEEKLKVNDFIINGKNYNPFGTEALSSTNKTFFFAGGLEKLRNMTVDDKKIINTHIQNNPEDAGVQKFMSNVSSGGSAYLLSNTSSTEDGRPIRKLAFEATGITSLDDLILSSLTSESYRGRKKSCLGKHKTLSR